jgi:hypothetical protein
MCIGPCEKIYVHGYNRPPTICGLKQGPTSQFLAMQRPTSELRVLFHMTRVVPSFKITDGRQTIHQFSIQSILDAKMKQI